MQELIKVTQTEQGGQVVSARELYQFLDVKRQFANWIKERIIKYGFREGEDYVEVSKFLETSTDDEVFNNSVKNPKGGRYATDYAITIDMAKELSMVERNDKGKEARRYFIDCEKKLIQIAAQPPQITTTDPALLHLLSGIQAQLVDLTIRLDQRDQIDRLREEVRQIQAGQKPARQLPAPPTKPMAKAPSLRQALNHKVNEYCGIHGESQKDAWMWLYKGLARNFGIHLHLLHKIDGESKLDTIERYGHLDKLYSIICAELNYVDE